LDVQSKIDREILQFLSKRSFGILEALEFCGKSK